MRHLRFFVFAAFYGSAALAADPDPSQESLGDLTQTKIYSASRKEEDPYKSPSATYVITEDDLKQMGVHHVADALRTVPGLEVSKISSNKWMVASRGFGEQFSNKLLVLVDGRPVYTTLFSGVLWDQEDVPISDIKQIEVIRGPGATLWGSNAVNGVINIITKSTAETLGTRISATTGFTSKGDNQTIIEAQHGQKIDHWGTARATIRVNEDPTYTSLKGTPGFNDSWQEGSANFRYDSVPSKNNSLTVQGNFFKGDVDQTYTLPSLVAPYSQKVDSSERSQGGYVQTIMTHTLDDASTLKINSYVDYTNWHYAESNPTYLDAGIDSQYDFIAFDDWETVAGLGVKMTADDIGNSPYLIYDPDHKNAQFLDTFLQTKIPIVRDKLDLTLGSKLETNSYVDLALSPSAKLAWYPTSFTMFWASVARADRTPSRGTQSLTTIVAGTPSGYVGLLPNDDFKPEIVTSYETGIRLNLFKGVHVDTSLFYDNYKDLRTFVPGPALGNIAIARYLTNEGEAYNRGAEVSATYQTTPDFKLTAGYTYSDMVFCIDPGTTDTAFQSGAKKWPKNMWSGRLSYNVVDDWTFNASAYYSSDLPAIGITGYTKVDSNLTWSALDNTDIILGVDNLTDNMHPEYSAQLYGEAEEVPRIVYVTIKISL